MKPAILFLVSALIFVFTAHTLATSILDADDDLVLDFHGNPLEKGVGYFLTLSGWGAASGRVWLIPPSVQNNETSCNVNLVRPSILPYSTPFTFTPINGSEDAIRLRSPLVIQSPTWNPCGDSTIWKISYREELFTSIITTGGIFNTMSSCFHIVKTQIQSLGTFYGIEHCRGTCGPTKEATMCFPVGTTRSKNGEDHLSVGGSPLWFYILKNSESATKQDVM